MSLEFHSEKQKQLHDFHAKTRKAMIGKGTKPNHERMAAQLGYDDPDQFLKDAHDVYHDVKGQLKGNAKDGEHFKLNPSLPEQQPSPQPGQQPEQQPAPLTDDHNAENVEVSGSDQSPAMQQPEQTSPDDAMAQKHGYDSHYEMNQDAMNSGQVPEGLGKGEYFVQGKVVNAQGQYDPNDSRNQSAENQTSTGNTGQQPAPQQPAPQQAGPHPEYSTGTQNALNKMPVGSEIGGFRKIDMGKSLGSSAWEGPDGQIALTNTLNQHASESDMQGHIQANEEPKNQGGSSGGSQGNRYASDADLDAMNVAQQFGTPQSSLNATSANNFVRLAAKQLGMSFDSDDPVEQAKQATAHLNDQIPRLRALVDQAGKLGHSSRHSSLVVKAKHAADGLINSARQAGWEPDGDLADIHDAIVKGDTDAAKDYQQQITDALKHMSNNSQYRSIYSQLAEAVGGERNLWLIGGTIAALWFAYGAFTRK